MSEPNAKRLRNRIKVFQANVQGAVRHLQLIRDEATAMSTAGGDASEHEAVAVILEQIETDLAALKALAGQA